MTLEELDITREVEELLVEADLPVSDLSGVASLGLLGIREQGLLVGVVGIEVHGRCGLLRSLAVIPARRGAGLGLALVSGAEAWAAGRGIVTLYLLTTTAARFFARLGYETIPRSGAPAAIGSTTQFAQLCPASSTFMRKGLSGLQQPGATKAAP